MTSCSSQCSTPRLSDYTHGFLDRIPQVRSVRSQLTQHTNEIATVTVGLHNSSLLVSKWLHSDAATLHNPCRVVSPRRSSPWHVVVECFWILFAQYPPIAAHSFQAGSCSELQYFARSVMRARLNQESFGQTGRSHFGEISRTDQSDVPGFFPPCWSPVPTV